MDLDPNLAAQAKIVTASGAGAFIRLYFKPSDGVWRTAWACFCSILCGIYATPVVVEFWGLSADSYRDGLAAALGLLGLSIADMILRGCDRFDLAAFVKRKFQ